MFLLVTGWIVLSRASFRSSGNLAQVAQDIGFMGIFACGETLVVLTGGIDLSVAAVAACAACVGGGRMMAGWHWLPAMLLGLVTGLGIGWVNGVLITYRRLPPLLTTLATWFIVRSLTNIVTGALPYNRLPDAYKSLGRGAMPIYPCLLLLLLTALLLMRTRFGRRVVAVGGSVSAARLSGVPVDAILRRVYAFSGGCAALAGLLMAAAANNAQWTTGEGSELEVIAAVVVGGVRLTGGEGSVFGAALGAAILVVLKNALFLYGVSSDQYGLVVGAVILLVALSEQLRRNRLAADV